MGLKKGYITYESYKHNLSLPKVKRFHCREWECNEGASMYMDIETTDNKLSYKQKALLAHILVTPYSYKDPVQSHVRPHMLTVST